ncbi:beta-1,6-N-acetylglucosaminyltransferase [Parafilimonas sp.]|uniref:beta-1,6-N-acetylglucosaminyltransferase n=1 Tax=Parafilimonas sp. TaxID=1969739 RepID=UPI0039E4B166
MKIAFLILGHKNPKQLQMLLHALQHPAFHFYVHIDKKADAGPFQYLSSLFSNVSFIKKRAKIYWAAFGTIQATLNGFNEIPLDDYAYVNVISAQDFPLRPASEIYEYILKRKGTEFITCESIEDEWPVAPRVKRYHLINWRIPGRYRLGDLLTYILPERKFPVNHTIVGRANWFTLTTKAIQYSLDFLKKNPAVIRYYKYCWGADEFIFSTILYNSSFKTNIAENLVYVKWNADKNIAHPEILTIDDFDELVNSSKLFARKFDIEKEPSILKKLEAYIGVTEATAERE